MKIFPKALLVALALLLASPLLADITQGKGIFAPQVVTELGRTTDGLYKIILVIVTVIFVITEGMIAYSLIFFRARAGHKARFFHGSTTIELILAMIPALILVYITATSSKMWSDLRFKAPQGKDVVHVQVFAKQFAWQFRYAGKDGVFGTADDVMSFNQLVLPVNKPVVFHISSKDVIHSFFIPEARQKQDAVPGLLAKVWVTIDRLPVWDRESGKRVLLEEKDYSQAEVAISGYEFKSKVHAGKGMPFQQASSEKINLRDYYYERNSDSIQVARGGKVGKAASEPRYIRHHYEIGCAQLCGTSHYAMRGEVQMLSDAEFQAWLGSQAYDAELANEWNNIWDKYHADFNKIL